jgi:octaprenyl-diphosphate synthase
MTIPSLAAPSVTNSDFAELVLSLRDPLLRLEAFLQDQITEFEPEVQSLVEETLKHSGKKIRPLLVFLAGLQRDHPEPALKDLIKVAAVVELVHLATLVHDDILDNASLRHGSATLSASHGAHRAVLLGDALFAHALKLAAEFPDTAVCRAVAEATRQVCSGEIAQTFTRGSADISLAAYRRIIDLKTAELFSVSAQLGAFIGTHNPEYATAAAQFARHLGIAYQIYDDLVDICASEQKVGKTLGTDLATGKLTLPLILLREKMDQPDFDTLLQSLHSCDSVNTVLEKFFSRYGIINATVAHFEKELAKADACLAPFTNISSAQRLPDLTGIIRGAMQRIL